MQRPNPRISVLKLAEYLGAGATRRRAIIRTQQKPPDHIVPLYRMAMAPAIAFFRRGDLGVLERAVERLESINPASEWQERDLANSALALRHLINVAPKLDLGDRVLGGRRSSGNFWLSGVEVSVRPHVRVWRSGEPDSRVGAVKLAFGKTRPLAEREGRRAATLLRYYIDVRLAGTHARAAPELCQVVDVFREEVYTAPEAFRRTVKEATAACEEINFLWAASHVRIQPPPQPTPPG